MKPNWKRIGIGAAIALGSIALTLVLSNIQFFRLLELKASDANFVLRGKVPARDIVIVGIDEKAEDNFPEPNLFWHRYYADVIKGAADAGARVLVLDVAFGIPVSKWEPDNDGALAEAVTYASQKMPLVSAFVASSADQSNPAFAVPINMLASAFGMSAMANLTDDADDFVRRQELIEAPKEGVPPEALTRSMALRAAEKFTGKNASVRNGRVFLGNREIPTDGQRNMIVNYAGPADTFPRVSIYDFVKAERAGDLAKLSQWVKGKAVFLGPDNIGDRHATPFFTAFSLTDKWMTPGVEIHASSFNTILTGKFLQPVAPWARIAALTVVTGATVAIMTSFAVSQTALWSIVLLAAALTATHLFFLSGWLFSSTEILIGFVWALIGGIIYRFATAEKKSSFFKSAVALFVGKQVATSLEQSGRIGLTGKRQMVTILFTDIRGFTAFCESKDPALVVDLLNVYMAKMVSIIVRHHGHVNKFIGDGILAVFSDDDEGARPGDHAWRAVTCATEMVTTPGDFKTGAGLHSGEVVIGNVGSSDKMEFTVLGDTVNLASRLESLNKEHKTKLLLSEETREMAGGTIDTLFLGDVPVRGKTVPMKLYTVVSLVETTKQQPVHATGVTQ
ncbi:MAG TPA: adenylate/guanylate cyclase domain-containing protein [Bryobacteraceae bacterium]|nr:adenylate/guanylate cyclase domain-containing protein [Bryobacteraceae bacterium]